MDRIPLLVLPILMFLLMFPMSDSSVDEYVKQSLVLFMEQITEGNNQTNLGWNITSDPCNDNWVGVICDSQLQIKKIVLDQFNLTGYIDATSLCTASSLAVLSLTRNYIVGFIPDDMRNCENLTHLYISDNQISGPIPDTLLQLSNLRRLDISNNYLSGDIPNLLRISGLLSFLAQGNQLSGTIPDFSFSNLQEFNVSNNKLSGKIPDILSGFTADSFSGNPGLCGKPLLNACPRSGAAPTPAPAPSALL